MPRSAGRSRRTTTSSTARRSRSARRHGAAPIRFMGTQPAGGVAGAIGVGGVGGGGGWGSAANFLVDSSAWNGQVNVSWSPRLPNGDPVPAGSYTVVVEARLGQNTFS